eukprot:365387-Chlamydomonas_euryale.AAC.11
MRCLLDPVLPGVLGMCPTSHEETPAALTPRHDQHTHPKRIRCSPCLPQRHPQAPSPQPLVRRMSEAGDSGRASCLAHGRTACVRVPAYEGKASVGRREQGRGHANVARTGAARAHTAGPDSSARGTRIRAASGLGHSD